VLRPVVFFNLGHRLTYKTVLSFPMKTQTFGGFYFIARGMLVRSTRLLAWSAAALGTHHSTFLFLLQTEKLSVFPGVPMPVTARMKLQKFSGPLKVRLCLKHRFNTTTSTVTDMLWTLLCFCSLSRLSMS